MNFFQNSAAGAKFLLSYLRKKENFISRPLVVMIEPTNHCNLECVMCPNSKIVRKKGYMDFEDYQKIINLLDKLK